MSINVYLNLIWIEENVIIDNKKNKEKHIYSVVIIKFEKKKKFRHFLIISNATFFLGQEFIEF